MAGRTSWGTESPGPHPQHSEFGQQEPFGDPPDDAALGRDDDSPGAIGGDDRQLRHRAESARERVLERLGSAPPSVSTEDLHRAVESLARRVEATSAGRGGGRGERRLSAWRDEPPAAAADDMDDILDRDDPRRGAPRDLRHNSDSVSRRTARADARADARNESLGMLDRLEARLDSLSERVDRSRAAPSAAPSAVHGPAASGTEAAPARDMSRQFLALEQRIDALREAAEANGVSAVRDDLSRLGRQVETIAGDHGDIAEAINAVRNQLDRHYAALQDHGGPDAAALVAIERHLDGLAEQVGRFELAPAALDAVERGYSQVVEHLVKIERLAEGSVPPEDLWDRIEAIRSQIGRLPSREAVTALENRLLELADRVDAAASGRDDAGIVRLENQLEKIAFSLADIGVRKDAEADELNRRLADVVKRLDRMEADSKPVDFTPIEVQLSDIAARLDTRLRGPADRAVAAIEKRLDGLARAFDDQLDLAAAGLAPLERKLDGLTGLVRDLEMTSRGPDITAFDQRLDDLQARLGEIGIEIRRSGGAELQRRLDDLAARIDAIPGGETHIDIQPVAERLDHLAGQLDIRPVAERLDRLAEQINAFQPAPAPDLNPIHARLDELAAAFADTTRADGENPLAAQLAEISAMLNADREHDVDVTRVAALMEKLETALERGQEPDFIALADRMVKLNETLESAAELASLEDISDLRSEIATLRRELRSLPATGGEGNEIMPILQDLAGRIDALSSEPPATHRDLEDQMGRIMSAIELSAGQDTAVSQIAETLTAIQATLDDAVRYGGLASEEALGDGQGANLLMQLGRALREDLGQLRAQAVESERRTQDSLNALSGALASVTGRVAAFDPGGYDHGDYDSVDDNQGDVAPVAMQPHQPAEEQHVPVAPEPLEPLPAQAAVPEPPQPQEAEQTQSPAPEIPPAAATDAAETAAAPMFDPAMQAADATGHDANQPQAAEAEPKAAMHVPILETDEDDAPITSSIEQDVAAQQSALQQQQRNETSSLIAAIRGIEPKRESLADAETPAEAPAGPSEFAAPMAPETAEAEPAPPEPAGPATDEPQVAEPELAAPEAADGEEPADEITIGDARLPGNMPPEASPSAAEPGTDEPQPAGTLDFAPEPRDADMAAPSQSEETGKASAAGSQGLLGRLTSSQLLKRATGGKSESFTPGPDDSDEPDALLEPGTDGPMMSELDGAPSSDTAGMSGEKPKDGKSSHAGAASIEENVRPGTGFTLPGDDENDNINDFLAAARRAARAAVIEAAEAERYAQEHRPAGSLERILSAINGHRKTILIGAVLLAVAFAAWQYMQSRDGIVAPQIGLAPQSAPQQPAAPANIGDSAGQATAQTPGGPAVATPTAEVTFADPSPQPGQFSPPDAGTQAPATNLSPPPARTPLPAETDLPALRAAAEAGNRDAQFNTGLAYTRGLGVEKDYVEAYKWFDIAAQAGDPQAAARRDALAKVMTADDLQKARAGTAAWFIASAEKGDRDAQFNTGLAYTRGLGVEKDYVEAYKWFDIAAQAGDPQAAARRDALAKVMTADDLDRAKAAAAASLGLTPPQAAADTASPPPAGRAEAPVDPAIDLSLITAAVGSDALRAAAISGDHAAEFEVATRFADERFAGRDLAQAVYWYTRAAEGGLAPAQYRLASIYEKGIGVRRNPASAHEWYRRAARAGNVKAMHNLGVLFAEGAAGKPDLAAAAHWFKRAAEHGVRDSQFNAGILYARGLGVTQDFIEAYKWFAIAAHSGDEQAKARREAIASAMSAERLAVARAAVEAFKPAPLDPAANFAPEPNKGWGEPAAATTSEKVGVNLPDLVSQAQTQLARLGFDPGPADGRLGPKTRQAVEAFQAAAGLDVTGEIDVTLLDALKDRQI